MNKYEAVSINVNKLSHFMRNNHAPEWLQEELNTYIKYSFSNQDWLSKAVFQQLSNGYFVGELSIEGDRNGTGIYVWNSGDIYIGDYYHGKKHGDGFYYDASSNLTYYGGWENDDKHGHGYVWGPGYESQGYYQNGKEIRNDYVRNESGYHSNNTSISDEEGKGCGCLIMIVIAVLIWWIFF